MADKTNQKTGLSFGFTKKQEIKQLSQSIASEKVEKEDTETDYILSLEGKEVKSTKTVAKPATQEYVIPLIKQNKWRLNNDPNSDGEKKRQDVNEIFVKKDSNSSYMSSIDQQAVEEILQDTAKYNEVWEDRGKEDTTLAIPLLMQNKVPLDFESDEKLDVALRPNEPCEADYEQIPIQHFGMAMLRGMGWNETRGIGKKGKVTAPIEAHLRPKGLGLGADRNNADSDKKTTLNDKLEDNGEELILKRDAHCVVTAGINKDLYGTVEGLDEDNSRVMVKLVISGKVVNIMQCNVRVVGQEEFVKFSKYLNKQKVDKYKEVEIEKIENGHLENNSKGDHKSKTHRHDKRKNELFDGDCDATSKHKRKKHKKDKHGMKNGDKDSVDGPSKSSRDYRDNSKHPYSKLKTSKESYRDGLSSDSQVTKNVPSWLQNDLRVRIIDRDIKKGKYYKEKVVIIDVPSFGKCVCKTDDGKVLENVPQSSLETTIPKLENAYVAIVCGSHRGQIAQVMKRDKDQCLALVQLLSDRDLVLKLQYDDICEFVGDIHNHDDY